jgi:hypothetical protein
MKATLAPRNRRSEDIGVEPIVVPELKLRDVQRQIFAADFVEASDNSAFEDRPETFNRVGVDSADNMLSRAVIDNAVRKFFAKVVIAPKGVGADQTDFVGNGFAHEIFKSDLIDLPDDAGDDIAFAPYRTDDGSFEPVITATAGSTFLIPMAIVVLAADVGFINLDNAAKLIHVLFDQGRADFVAHEPSGFDRTKTHVAPDLARTHSLLAGQHKVSDFEPVAERLVGVLEDRPGNDRKPIASRAARRALRALPMPLAGRQVIDSGVAATRTVDAFGPSAGLQIGLAGILVIDGEHPVKLGGSQLVDGLRHGSIPSQWKDIAL